MSSHAAAKRRRGRLNRHRSIRRRLAGTPARPRLAVFRSSKHIYAQVIDDVAGHTLAAASSLDAAPSGDLSGKSGRDKATLVGQVVAERAKAAGVSAVVFDRGGFQYHGRVRALADAAREAGLEF